MLGGDGDEESDPEGLMDGVGFLESEKLTCDSEKLFLDSCATNRSMFAKEFLENVHRVKLALRQNCNAGSRTLDHMGTWMSLKCGRMVTASQISCQFLGWRRMVSW